MAFALPVRVDALRSTSFGSITNTYVAVGTAFAHRMRVVKMTNNTDGDLLVSFDGTTDNCFVPKESFTLYDFSSNSESSPSPFSFQIGTQTYVKYSTAPTAGAFYIECVYGKGE